MNEIKRLRDKQLSEMKKNYELLERAIKEVDMFNEV
jgi:hypothetical protein